MKGKGVGFLIIFGIIFFILYQILLVLKLLILPLTVLALIVLVLFLLYKLYKTYYFKSSKFRNIKEEIQTNTNNCNELNKHIEELKNSFVDINSYDYGSGQMYDNSIYKFKRTAWNNEIKKHKIHNCSATICKNASNQPLKYLCKYFDIDISEKSLENFESVLNDFAAAEQGKNLLQNERDLILTEVSSLIPWLIYNFDKKQLIDKLGFDQINFTDLYFPIYTFQYISAGGNSSTKCDITLDIQNLDKLILYLNDIIKFRKTIQGQRALMTTILREKIKSRDNFTCKKCCNSISIEKNLLLEIDHIFPISRGGLTTEDNLQTLCWKCNRPKGAKLEAI